MIPAGLNREKRTMILAGPYRPKHKRPSWVTQMGIDASGKEFNLARCTDLGIHPGCIYECPSHAPEDYSKFAAKHVGVEPQHRGATHPPHERSRAECECDQWCVPSCPVHDAVEYSAAGALHKAESR